MNWLRSSGDYSHRRSSLSASLYQENRRLACSPEAKTTKVTSAIVSCEMTGKPLFCNLMVTNAIKKCPRCGAESDTYLNPLPTVDIIIELEDQGILLIKRKNYPLGWAIPGGFVDYGESLEAAAIREAKEETGLDVKLIRQFHTYSNPERDPRHHAISTVYIANACGTPRAADDAAEVEIFTEDTLPAPIAFDHRDILADYFTLKKK